jgi:hypothetical protein
MAESGLQQSVSAASDIFALGSVMYSTLAHGKKLCAAHNNAKTFRGIHERLARDLDLSAVPENLRELVIFEVCYVFFVYSSFSS